MSSPPRYTKLPFPAYRHVPGKTPHPTRSPDGHSHAREVTRFAVDAESWRESEPYLYAIDLFNHGYYWEAHEVLEALWHGAGHDSPAGRLARALIQAAAALLKLSMREHATARGLAAKAAAKLRSLPAECLGVSTHAFANELITAVEKSREAPTVTLGAPLAPTA